MPPLKTNNILATSSTATATKNASTESAFQLNYSPSQRKAIITLQSPDVLQGKKFLYAVSENLALDRAVFVNCGEFSSHDFLELTSLRNGMWSPGEYTITPSRKIVTALLPDGESLRERTNTNFAAAVWNASRGGSGGEVDFTSKMLILQAPSSTGEPRPHLFIVMQRITEDADIPPFDVDNDDGGLLDIESDREITFTPNTEPNYESTVTLTATSGSELIDKYIVDKLLTFTQDSFQVTIAKDLDSTDGLTIIEGSDETEDGLNANEVQINYTILDETMQDVFTALVDELISRGKTAVVVREDPFFQIQELDYMVVERCKSNNKVKITLSDFDDCDYNNAFLPLVQKMLEEGKTVTLFFCMGELDPQNNWKINSIIHELSDTGLEINLLTGINQNTEKPVYVLYPEKSNKPTSL